MQHFLVLVWCFFGSKQIWETTGVCSLQRWIILFSSYFKGLLFLLEGFSGLFLEQSTKMLLTLPQLFCPHFTTSLKILPSECGPSSWLAQGYVLPSWRPRSPLRVFDAIPITWTWHIARISLGQGEGLADVGAARSPFFPEREEMKDTAAGKAHMHLQAISVCPYGFLGLWAPKHKLKLSWGYTCSNHRLARKSASTQCIYLKDKAGTECWEMWTLLSFFLTARAPPSAWKQSVAAPSQSICLSGSLDCENHRLWTPFLIHPILHKSKPFFLLPLWSHPNFFPESASLFSSLILWSSLL